MKPVPTFYYTCWGRESGGCGLRHASVTEAHACLDAETIPAIAADRTIRFVPGDADLTVTYDNFALAERAQGEAIHAN